MKRTSLMLLVCGLCIASFTIIAFASFLVKDKTVMIYNNAVANKNNQVDILVTTKNVENITATTATCKYNYQVHSKDKVKITFSGVRVLKHNTIGPKSFGSKLVGADYIANLSGLTPNSIYTAQAYVTTATETFNGNIITFETKAK